MSIPFGAIGNLVTGHLPKRGWGMVGAQGMVASRLGHGQGMVRAWSGQARLGHAWGMIGAWPWLY